jgi:hypothetical protein
MDGPRTPVEEHRTKQGSGAMTITTIGLDTSKTWSKCIASTPMAGRFSEESLLEARC